MAAPFAALQDDFLRYITDIVYCTVTTVGPDRRPRSRIMHPVFEVVDGLPRGAVVTDRSPIKVRHLAENPHVSCSYWSPAQNVVHVDAIARWAEGDQEKQEVWDLCAGTPEPLGFDPGTSGYGDGGIHHPQFHPLVLTPYRVSVLHAQQLADGDYSPTVWQAPGS